MFSLLATLFSAAAIVAAQGTCSRPYIVQEGDYCDAISAAQNSSTYQLAVSNYQTINDGCTNLVPQQVVCLGFTGQDCTTTYVVKEGDYCDLISSNFNINSTLLRTNNPQIDDNCYNLYVGEVLCVASTVLVTPAPAGWTLPGSNLDDGSFDDTPVVSGTSASVAPATTVVATTTAAATTSAIAAAGAVDNDVVTPNTTNGSDCDDDSDSATESDDDSGSDDDVPDCDD